jgi:hypothetical protein
MVALLMVLCAVLMIAVALSSSSSLIIAHRALNF